ncbi:hypothetical protein ACFSHQ_06515 [Gemmobacter lanyuensis]
MLALAHALPPLADRLAAGRLHGDPEAVVGVNDSGDKQKALDVAAHDHMLAALRRRCPQGSVGRGRGRHRPESRGRL